MRMYLLSIFAPLGRTAFLLMAGLGVAIMAGHPLSGAQQPRKVYRLGILDTAASDPTRVALWDVFKQRLRDSAFVEGRNIQFEFRFADGRQERLPSLALDLVRLKVDVIVTAGTPAVTAASRATTTIPIVMATGTAPSARNIVGVIDAPRGLSAKRLQLLRQALPTASSLAILADRGNPSSPPAVRETLAAAKSSNIIVGDYWVSGPDELKSMIAMMKKDGVAGFVTAPGAMFFAQRRQIAARAIKHRLASLSVRSDYAEAGFLIAYGSPIQDNYRQAAVYVDHILKGAKPSELPAYEPTELELVINLTTADAIGLTIPPALLATAKTIGP